MINSDAAYLIVPKARNRVAWYHYLGNKDGKLFNDPIYVPTKITKAVMSYSVEAEWGGLYINVQETTPLIITLEELGNKQDPVQLKTNNITAKRITNKTIKQKQIKAMYM